MQGRISRSEWRVIMLASLGGALEFYDFVVYGIFAKYIAAAFFPQSDSLLSLIVAFAVFAVGYFARPIGGMVLSHFGDKYGRRRVFIASMLCMSLATVGMGLLPPYAVWGGAATLLMVALRIAQGFFLGGELPGAITYVSETAPRKAGLACGMIFVCVNTGVLFAALLSLFVHEVLTPDQLAAWGWRIGFLFGGVMGLISFWLRLSLEETPEFARMKHAAAKAPLPELLKGHGVQVLVAILCLGSMSAYNGLLIAHMPSYLASPALGYSDLQASQAQNLCLVVISLLLPVFAWLGDKIPRRLILGWGSVLTAALAWPYYQALVDHSVNLYLLVVVWGASAATFLGTFSGIAADLFPTRVRFSGVAVSMNVSVSVFSGTAPLIATALIRGTGSPIAPAFYLIPVLLAAFAASFLVKRYGGQILGEVEAADAALKAAPAGE